MDNDEGLQRNRSAQPHLIYSINPFAAPQQKGDLFHTHHPGFESVSGKHDSEDERTTEENHKVLMKN